MDQHYQQLWKEIAEAESGAEAVRTLAEILADKEGRIFILRLERKNAKLCIEVLDRGIVNHNLGAAEKQNFFITLRRLAACHGKLPDSMIITKKVRVANEILASGGFSDIRSGSYMGHRVAVKALRVAVKDDVVKIRNQFCKEVVLWSTLSHPNVLKLVGVRGNMERGQFITVSEWMTHGNIMEYIKINPVNRLELLHGAAQGLEYLHGASLIHGDLKGANVLMSNDTPPRACLADFGFMTMVLDPEHPMSCSTQLEGGTMTFMSPELLGPKKFGMENSRPTTQSDIYAFGLVIFQVLTGEIPFRSLGPVGFVYSVVEGLRPDKPENASAIGFSDSLWDFAQRCWDEDMGSRPQVEEVVVHLGVAAAGWDGVMSPRNAEDVASGSNDPTSDTMKYARIFLRSSNDVRKGSTDSRTNSGLFSPSTPSTQYTEPSLEEPQEAATPGPSNKPQFEPWVPRWLQQETYPHLNQRYKPPPSKVPRKKPTAFKYLKLMFRDLFHRSPANQS